MLEKVLQELGLSSKEQLVYKLILERGKIAPALVARHARLNRTTVYSVAKELKEKGLIVEDLGGKTLYYLPVRENELEKIITSEEQRLKKKKETVRELQDLLKNMPESKTYSVPKIRFVDEFDMEHYIYEATPRWFDSMKDNELVCRGFQDHTLVERFEDWIDWSWEHSPAGYSVQLFTNESDIEKYMEAKKYRDRRKMKFWTGTEFTGSQFVFGNYIILAMTREKPYYLVEIHDAVLAHNMREVFKKLWKEEK